MNYTDYSELTDEHKFIIVDAVVRTRSVIEAQKEVNSGNEIQIETSTIMRVAKEYQKEIASLKTLYSDNFSDIKIANLRNRLEKLEAIYEKGVSEVEVGFDPNGIPKKEPKYLAVALRAVEAADRMLAQFEALKIRKAESKNPTNTEHESRPPTLSVQVLHTEGETE